MLEKIEVFILELEKVMGSPLSQEKKESEFFKQASSIISADRSQRAIRFHFECDFKITIYTELLLRKIIAEKFSIAPDRKIEIKNGEKGKPFVDGFRNFEFSISHTKNTIVITVYDQSIGVDIESLNVADSYLNIMRHFAIDEQEYIKSSQDEQIYRFIEIWTKKEAYLKALGIGLYVNLSSFSVLNKNYITINHNQNYISIYTQNYSNLQYQKILSTENDINKFYNIY